MTEENQQNPEAGPALPPQVAPASPPPLPPLPGTSPTASPAPVSPLGETPLPAGVPPVPPLPPGGFTAGPATVSVRPTHAAWFSGRGILHAAIAGAVGVGFALVASVVVLILSILGFMVSGGIDDTQAFGLDVTSEGLGFFAGVIWLTALGLFGQLSVTLDMGGLLGGSGAASGTLFVVPVLVLIAGVIGSAWWSYRSEHTNRTTSRWGIWVFGAASGLMASVLLLLLSLLGRSSTSTGVLGSSLDVSVWTFTLGTLFGPLFVVGLAAVLGRWLARGAVAYRHFGQALWFAPSRFRWGTRDVWDYIVVLAMVFSVVALIVALVQGDGALGALPSLLGQAVIAAASIAHFGAVGATATVPQPMTAFYGYFSSGLPATVWLLLLAAVVSAVGAAVLIGRRRRMWGQPPLRDMWRLPVLTAAVAVILGVSLGSIYAVGGMDIGFSGGGNFAASLVPALWTYPLVVVWAGVVEVLARFVTPSVIAALPFAARLTLVGDAPAPVAPAGPVASSGATAASNPQPLSPRAKKRILVFSIVGGAALILAVAAGIVISSLQSTVYSPSAAAERYVDAVSDGRFAEARAMESGSSNAGGPLLSSDSVALLAGMEDIEISDRMSGTSGQLIVNFTLDGRSVTERITMRSSGKEFLFFDTWEVSAGLAGDAQVWARDLEAITVGGVEIAVPDDGVSVFAAYPGSYEVSAPSSEWMSAVAEPLVVQYGYGSGSVDVQPTPALTAEVQDQIHAALDQCAALATLDDADCPFNAWSFREIRNVTWKIDKHPEIELSRDGVWVQSVTRGSATATWEEQDFSGAWGPKTYTDTFNVWGEVVVDGESVTVSFD